ncbi:MAG TPA: AraC family transcriptional regulator [Rhodanobacteraceae bacterium]|nr:AraC family transcriptional regulator [Rhodanobacteraceae bacterium]
MTYTPRRMLKTPGRRKSKMAVDLLSDVLTLVRLTGALVFRVDFHGPWGVAGHPTLEKFAPLLPPGTNQVMAFHVVLDGKCWVQHATRDWFAVSPGEAVLVPHGDLHGLGDQPGRSLTPFVNMLGGRSLPDLRHVRFDTGPGRSSSLLCGFLGCDRHAFEPLFHALPPLISVNLGERLNALVRYAVNEALDDRPGAASLRVRLAELLFTEALRTYMQVLPADATGWLAGLRDPLVGRSLRALHADPCRRWTVEELAHVVASSRSCLATRFRELIGEAPMHYLTHLRMQLAARHLSQSRCSVASLATMVGYDSSAAFQRAFKRHFGVPPATWRRTAQQGIR